MNLRRSRIALKRDYSTTLEFSDSAQPSNILKKSGWQTLKRKNCSSIRPSRRGSNSFNSLDQSIQSLEEESAIISQDQSTLTRSRSCLTNPHPLWCVQERIACTAGSTSIISKEACAHLFRSTIPSTKRSFLWSR